MENEVEGYIMILARHSHFSCDEFGERELNGGVSEIRDGVMKPERVYLLSEGNYVDFSPPEQ